MKGKLLIFMIAVVFLFNEGLATGKPILPREYQSMLKVGIDVDWVNFSRLAIEYQKYHDEGVNVPKSFKEIGFDHVRIRIKDEPLSTFDEKTGETLLEELKNVVNDCLKADIIPVLTCDASRFREHPSLKTLNETVEWWKNIAQNFKSYSYLLSYDLIIETSGKISGDYQLLNSFYKKVIPIIRKVDKYRMIFISPADVSNPYELPKLWYPQNDKFVMIEWHFYAAGPSKTNKKKLWTTGTSHEKNLILDKINFAKNWCEKHKLYGWVGAWMPTNYNKINVDKSFYDGAPAGGYYTLQEEIHFASFMSKSLKNAHIPFAINADTKFFDLAKLKWYNSAREILNAILN